MEKFGIFELLDTLSAFASAQEAPQTEQTEPPAEQPPVQKADVNDKAFAPPPALSVPSDATDTPPQTDAFAALIERHENISKKIDGRKKP